MLIYELIASVGITCLVKSNLCLAHGQRNTATLLFRCCKAGRPGSRHWPQTQSFAVDDSATYSLLCFYARGGTCNFTLGRSGFQHSNCNPSVIRGKRDIENADSVGDISNTKKSMHKSCHRSVGILKWLKSKFHESLEKLVLCVLMTFKRIGVLADCLCYLRLDFK